MLRIALVAGCGWGSALAGCAKLDKVQRATLPRAQMSADSVVLDIYFVRVPLGDPLANDQLWTDADEQQLPADLRLRLADHGIRAGILGSQIPPALEKLVADPKQEKVAAASAELPAEEAPPVDPNVVTEFEAEPRVMHQHLQLRAGKPGQIQTSRERENLVLLETQAGLVGGRSYRKGQGVLELKSYPQPDGRVWLELVPQLHHDDPKIEYVDQSGAWMPDVRRPRRLFPELKIDAKLTAGEMLVLTCLPDQTGSFGHHCFSESSSHGITQKLLIIRISQTQHTAAD